MNTIFDADSYYLINAKVKGGNSGGPIINNLGFAIGMITDIPLDSDNREKFDHLNYGVAITRKQLRNFINKINKAGEVHSLPIKHTETGFSTI